ncbi:hypothetical protein GCM10028802_29630 [Terrabacter terrigena]
MLAGGWFILSTLLAAGFGPRLTDDALTWSLLSGPGLAFVTVTLVRPRPSVPARLLWSGRWSPGLPLGAALDARRAWMSDREEARRLLAFAAGALGVVVTIASLLMVSKGPAADDAPPAQSRMENMTWAARAFTTLLWGTFDPPASTPATWTARAGLALFLAAIALYWWPTADAPRGHARR